MKHLIEIRSLTTAGVLAALVALGWGHAASDVGTFAPDGVFRCGDLHSSGADEESVFILLTLMIVPAFLRLLRFRKPLAWWERALFLIILALLYMLVFEVTDCADFIVTARVTRDANLIGALTLLPASFLLYVWPNVKSAPASLRKLFE